MLARLRRLRKANKNLGFTIVELLIVIVVIGVLAAIVIVAYNGVTQGANASAIADSFKKFEKAMRLYATSQSWSTWPGDSTLTGSGNPNVASLISNVSGFSNYMPSPPNVAGVSPSSWRYDNDSDTYNGCAANGNGTNVFIDSLTDTALATRVDEIIDDGNTACGKLRFSGSALVYSLSNNSSF
jgi:prepilin-type N-terminal cleavage/methylation domain-containing protein